MAENNTTPHRNKMSLLYRAGDIVIFKYEGNVRARVMGQRLIDGKVWLEAEISHLSFVIPASEIIGTEPRGDD